MPLLPPEPDGAGAGPAVAHQFLLDKSLQLGLCEAGVKLGSPPREMQPRTHRSAYTFPRPVTEATPGGSSDPPAVSQTFLCPRTTWECGLGRGWCSRPLSGHSAVGAGRQGGG